MTLNNKLNISDSVQLARAEEELSKTGAIDHSYAYEGYSAFSANDLSK